MHKSYCINLYPHSPKDNFLWLVWLKLHGRVVFGKEIFYVVNQESSFPFFHCYLLLEKGVTLKLNKPESLSPKNALCKQYFVEHILMVLENILKVFNVFNLLNFVWNNSWKGVVRAFILTNLIPHTHAAWGGLVLKLVDIDPVDFEKKIFHCCQCILDILLFVKRMSSFLWTVLNLLNQKFYVFGRNCSYGSGKDDAKLKNVKTDRRRTTSDQNFQLRWA